MINSLGQLIWKGNARADQLSKRIDLNGIKSGLYYIFIQAGNKKPLSHPLVIGK